MKTKMSFIARFICVGIYTAGFIFVINSFGGCSPKEVETPIVVNAKGAVILEAVNGRVIFEKNPDGRFPPASTAKIMTAIVAIERMPLKKEITPGENVVNVEPTVAKLVPGVRYSLEELIKAILIKSANDAAFVIAEAVAGSEEKFARLMNKKAKKIGMKNTNFATASGLPTGKKDSQYTTAMDLAKMMRYAGRHDVILEAISQKDADIYGSDGKRIYLKTHNKALLKDSNAPWGKTGYTREAKRTFVGIDPSMKPRIVFALLKSSDLWNDIHTLKDRGVEIYEKRHKTFINNLISWIISQNKAGQNMVQKVLR